MRQEKIINFFKNESTKKVITVFFYLLICYVVEVLFNGENTNFNIQTLQSIFSFPKLFYNLGIFLFAYFILYAITGKIKISCTIISVLTTIFGVINYIVINVRGMAITISDIFSVKTAISVASGIHININSNFIIAILLFLAINFILWKCLHFQKFKGTNKARITQAILGVVGIIIMYIQISDSNPFIKDVGIWNINYTYEKLGANVTIVRMLKDLRVKEPKNYSKEDAQNKLASYKSDIPTKEEIKKFPNVLVIANESFADLPSVYQIGTDNLTYFRKLMQEENVISGLMHSSSFGGGTANVEYEVLTQNTTAFLPTGSMPYQQYITKKVDQSIVSYMNSYNYETYGIHPYEKTGYSRAKIYPLLQFKNCMFKEEMPNLTLGLNGYPTDSSAYNYWYKIMKNKPKEEKNFTFLLTMENHLAYNNVDENLKTYSDNRELNSYLQGQTGSDKALEELITFIKNSKEDIILLFFGDHQPSVNLLSTEQIPSNYPKEEAKYLVPFFIFANFDIEEKQGLEVSSNYLQSILLEAAGMPKNAYTKYICELRQEIPVITPKYYKDKQGNFYSIEDTTSPYYNKLQEYWNLIYYQMFENK